MASTSAAPNVDENTDDFESLIKEESDEGEDDDDQAEYLDDFKMSGGMYLEDDEEEGLINLKSKSTSAPPVSQDPSSDHQSALIRDVVVTTVKMEEEPVADPLDGDDELNVDEHVFHLADEHALFRRAPLGLQGVAPSQAPDEGMVRGRGRGRRLVRERVPWVRGDRLIEIYMHDDDVPMEMKKMVMKVIAAREEEMRVKERNQKRRVEASNEETADVDDDRDEELFAGGEHSPDFEWSSMDTYECKREQFLPQKTGPVVECENAYGAFRQYWDDDILSHIVLKTNQYAADIAGASPTFAREWYDTNIHEILVLLSFWMMLGIIRMPSTKSCFSMNPLLQTNIFRMMFSCARYRNLCRALHFVDNTNRPPHNRDPLYCFGPILEHLKSRFMSVYVPSQEVCIDESLTMWKSGVSFRQCYKTKAAQFGVKTFELCESATGYLYSFFLYIGGATTYDPTFPSNLSKRTATVLKLIIPLLDKGYTLFIDQWFNSPLLARYLKTRKTDCVGPVSDTHYKLPPFISLSPLREGEYIARHAGDVSVLAFQDGTEKVTSISTFHGSSQGRVKSKSQRTAGYRPQLIIDYKKFMGGVNRKDQMLEPYELERKKCAKWYMKIFKRLLNCSILNSRILLQASTGAFRQHLVFRLELVDQILKQHLKQVPRQVARKVSGELNNITFLADKQNGHYPRLSPNRMESGRIRRRRCVWCSQRNHTNRRTSYMCYVCDVALCIDPCFNLYHADL